MTYATLMVHLQLGQSNAGLLKITAGLATGFRASVIGVAARQPLQMICGDGYVAGDLYERDRDELAAEMRAAELEFRTLLADRVPALEWRSTQASADLAGYLADEARSADLIVTSVATGDLLGLSRVVDTGALIMRAGRPVLLVPKAAERLRLERVLIGWKDTRETRRAVSDALPLLKHATSVMVVEITTDTDPARARRRVNDTVAWLSRHGIQAEGMTRPSAGDDAATIRALAQDQRADVVVAGAYGHSRLREWVLGGVTRDLLLGAERCAFVSH